MPVSIPAPSAEGVRLPDRDCVSPDGHGGVDRYRRRDPRRTAPYRLLVDHFETLLAVHADRYERTHGRLPCHLERLVWSYVECGILGAGGFARVRCADCHEEYLVPYSCKARYLCPSCHHRKALVWSEWLAAEVVADVPHRQWVFALPKRVRVFFLHDRSLLGELPRIASALLHAFYRAAAGRDDVRPGIVAVIQTWNSDLSWSPHLHLLVTEGCFTPDGGFAPIRLDGADGRRRLEEAFRREVLALLLARGLLDDDDVGSMLTWRHTGFSVDASVRIDADDRQGLLRLLRYMARGPVASSRLRYAGGLVRLTLPRPDHRRGDKELTLAPLDFLARWLMHVPPLHAKMWREYGEYATVPRAKRRAWADDGGLPVLRLLPPPQRQRCSAAWAALLQRVYGFDPLLCPKCGGQMRVLAFIRDRDAIDGVLDHLGLDGAVPPLQPPRAPPDWEQEALPFQDEWDEGLPVFQRN